MLAHFRPNHYRVSILWRTIYAVSVVIGFSYIFFEVLDLDSHFRSPFYPLYPVKGFTVAQDVLKDAERTYLPGLAELWGDLFVISSSSA